MDCPGEITMRNRRGAALVELMTAVALAAVIMAAAFPAVMTGNRLYLKKMEKVSAVMAGDAVFESLRNELRFADTIAVGSLEEKPSGEESWKAFYVSRSPENGHCEFMVRECGEDRVIYSHVFLNDLDLEIGMNVSDVSEAELEVMLFRAGNMVYSRKECVELLNALPQGKGKTSERRPVLWIGSDSASE